jgi:hypothetical protein
LPNVFEFLNQEGLYGYVAYMTGIRNALRNLEGKPPPFGRIRRK